MKQILLSIVMLFSLCAIAHAECNGTIPMNHQPNGSTHGGSGKSPVSTWYITQNDHVLTMLPTPCNYTLNLYDASEDVVYTVFVPQGTSMLIIPSTVSGSFEIRFETNTYYYYGFICL